MCIAPGIVLKVGVLLLFVLVPHIKEHQTVVCAFSVIYISYVLTFVSVAK